MSNPFHIPERYPDSLAIMFIKLFRKSWFSTPIYQNKMPLLNNGYMINLVGSEADMKQATREIQEIAEIIGHTVKVVKIVPSNDNGNDNGNSNGNNNGNNNSNNGPTWRVDLVREANSTKTVLINQVGEVSCDILTDLNRSVRAVSHGLRHPWAFKIDPNVSTRHESVLLGTNPYQFNCDQINQVYPLQGTFQTKQSDMEHYLRPFIQD